MGPGDYAENVGGRHDPDEVEQEKDDGCFDCGDPVKTGHAYCERCIDDMVKARRAADSCAALVTDFMLASNRARAVDDAGPSTDLGLLATEAA